MPSSISRDGQGSRFAIPTGRRSPSLSAARRLQPLSTRSGGFQIRRRGRGFINAQSIGAFGKFEYWFSTIKVAAILVFIVLGAALIFGVHQNHPIGLANFRNYGGFLPHGLRGAWLALAVVIYSFIGAEVVAVTAGEAKDPEKSVPRAMRTLLLRLVIFYVGAIVVLVGVIPWTEIQPGRDITVSPFVRVFDVMHIPAAAHIINFVVLTAALSSMNCNLYMATRMIFSLSRAGIRAGAAGPGIT